MTNPDRNPQSPDQHPEAQDHITLEPEINGYYQELGHFLLEFSRLTDVTTGSPSPEKNKIIQEVGEKIEYLFEIIQLWKAERIETMRESRSVHSHPPAKPIRTFVPHREPKQYLHQPQKELQHNSKPEVQSKHSESTKPETRVIHEEIASTNGTSSDSDNHTTIEPGKLTDPLFECLATYALRSNLISRQEQDEWFKNTGMLANYRDKKLSEQLVNSAFEYMQRVQSLSNTEKQLLLEKLKAESQLYFRVISRLLTNPDLWQD